MQRNYPGDFNQQIIRIVQDYPILFDRTHKLFFHDKFNDLAWEDIGNRLGRNGEECKTTYRNLYFEFGQHYAMKKHPELKVDGYPMKEFRYFYDMVNFYKDHIHLPRAIKRVKMTMKHF
uniref:MADF domain-containing protein n=1 Tax=Lutzomyia longipalpis TaxID=7200 RepID=A0A1B0CBR4_LUTLO